MTRVTAPMIARQARFAARSIADIASEPRRGRDVLRMLRTITSDTVTQRLPWLPFALIDELQVSVRDSAQVFEYGGGGSTLWFLDRGAHVTTVEHDESWATALERSAAGSGAEWALLRRRQGEEYVGAISEFPDEHFDVVVVDGRDRVACFEAAVPKVRPGGLLILDDADRSRYRPVLDVTDWPRRLVIGFAPCKPTLAYSAVFTRPAR